MVMISLDQVLQAKQELQLFSLSREDRTRGYIHGKKIA